MRPQDISVIPTPDMHILSEDAADRQRGEDYLKWLVDCAAALGADGIGGPLHQTLGHFSGEGTTEAEFDRARGVLTEAEAEAVRIEVSRRLLEAGKRAEGAVSTVAGGQIVATLLVPAVLMMGAFALYMQIGAPGARDHVDSVVDSGA